MMPCVRLIIPLFLASNMVSQGFAMSWQTTHGTYEQGSCILENNSVKATVYTTHLDVEEEAIIRTEGRIRWRGDPNSIEIHGHFQLPAEATVIGMLLWNGEEILKAKLKGKVEANSQYEAVVDRNTEPPPRPRDPAIIEAHGNGRYGLKIYPVVLGKSRKIRIRYLLPITVSTNGNLGHRLETIFRRQLHGIDTELRVFSGTGASRHFLSENGKPRPIAAPTALTVRRNSQIMIFPEEPVTALMSQTRMNSGETAGNYFNFYASVPQEILKWPVSGEATVQAILKTSEREYPVEATCSHTFQGMSCSPVSFHAKAEETWSREFEWILYNRFGKEMVRLTESAKWLRGEDDWSQQLLWAGSRFPFSRLSERFLGLKYGFVDRHVSLLALEEDAMGAEAQKPFQWEGVPRLSASDILAPDTTLYAFEGGAANGSNPNSPHLDAPISTRLLSGIASKKPIHLQRLTVHITATGMIQFPAEWTKQFTATMNIQLTSVTGKRVATWRVEPFQWAIGLPINEGIRPGVYLLHVRAAGWTQVFQLTLRNP